MFNPINSLRKPTKLGSFKRLSVVAFATTALISCSTTNLTSIIGADSNKEWDTLYLRGTFTWWDADERFRLIKINTHLYMASTELVADGQPYDFKIADKNWNPGYRCGYADKEKDEVLTLGSVSEANCDTPVDNFKFTPEESTIYYFYFNIKDEDHPLVYISKVKN